VSLAVAYRHAFRTLDLRPTVYLGALWPAGSACLVMAAAVVTVRLLTSSLAPALSLGCAIASGATAYVGTMTLLHRSRFSSLLAFVRTARRATAEG
jgi:ABC-type uncharacterized transport system permease subunit